MEEIDAKRLCGVRSWAPLARLWRARRLDDVILVADVNMLIRELSMQSWDQVNNLKSFTVPDVRRVLGLVTPLASICRPDEVVIL